MSLPLTRIIACSAEACEFHGGEDIGCNRKTITIDDNGRCLSCHHHWQPDDEGPQCHLEPAMRGDNHQPIPDTCIHEAECTRNGLRQSNKCKINKHQ